MEYLNKIELGLYIKTISKKTIILQNIFSQRKVTQKTSINLINLYVCD